MNSTIKRQQSLQKNYTNQMRTVTQKDGTLSTYGSKTRRVFKEEMGNQNSA